ncbi:hypothetical protein PsalMR5_04239 (plasmid) [Piscirickettsia salmonis]|uniref:hypothetical protein n=1 Tax=Piscirickettsia salmonis TaxID=1238 RepID=UPI0012BAF115|nr:hypothetical protein [Piscirickettsia salmonis]QGP56749.1 hypothetical protein PsalSR1_04238 [Piscirickettsia salmonis]QGP61634.1 hypothetical protein PsalBI1_04276 [Piscirickettsia salmonis]QGP66314.1 hypothetical protein PsalMR5_04239 [Piscirickettsia salmonis]
MPLFSDIRDERLIPVEAGVAAGAVIAGAYYIKSRIDKKERKTAEEILQAFRETLGQVDFPPPFYSDGEQISIPQELQAHTLKSFQYDEPYKRCLNEAGRVLIEYRGYRQDNGDSEDAIDTMLSYLHYIITSPAGFISLEGDNPQDYEKLQQLARFLSRFSNMKGAVARKSYIDQILEVIPVDPNEEGTKQKVNAYNDLQAMAESKNAGRDFKNLKMSSRAFADSALRLAAIGASPEKHHRAINGSFLKNLRNGVARKAIEKQGMLNFDIPPILLPGDDKFGFIHAVKETAHALYREENQAAPLFEVEDGQRKIFDKGSLFDGCSPNKKVYSKDAAGRSRDGKASDAQRAQIARGYEAMLQIAQLSTDMMKLAHRMHNHIGMASVAHASPFASAQSDVTATTLARCYQSMAILKQKADRLYQEHAVPLIAHLNQNRKSDRKEGQRVIYEAAREVSQFKKELDNAYGNVQKYTTMQHFQEAQYKSRAEIARLDKEVTDIAERHGFSEQIPETRIKHTPEVEAAHAETQQLAAENAELRSDIARLQAAAPSAPGNEGDISHAAPVAKSGNPASTLQTANIRPEVEAPQPGIPGLFANLQRTNNLIQIIERTMETVKSNEESKKGKILRILVNDLKGFSNRFITDELFLEKLKDVVAVACQHKGGSGGFRANATNTGKEMLHRIAEVDSIRIVIARGSGKLDLEKDVLKGFLGINDSKLKQERTSDENRQSRESGNFFFTKYLNDQGDVVRHQPAVIALAR